MNTQQLRSLYPTTVGSRMMAYAVVLFGVIAAFIAFDIVGDYRSGGEAAHIGFESVIMVFALAGSVLMWRQFRAVQLRASQLSVDLEAARHEAQRFREEAHDALSGLGEAIDHQF